MMPTSDLPTRQHIDLAPQLMTPINAHSLVVCREGLCAAYDMAKVSFPKCLWPIKHWLLANEAI